MTQDDVYMALTEIFRDIFERDEMILTPALSARDVDGWDSFKQIEIILSVQRKFGIKIASRELDNILNVGDLARVISAKLPAGQDQPLHPVRRESRQAD